MANKPNNPALWSRAKSMAKQKFDVYPSAYANGWAAKWYKSKGGTWRKAEYGMEVMGDGGTPDNPGFKALPPAVQQKIMDNMAEGGEKMPPEIARARFAAAGNLDKMSDYGYAYGGYIPEMMYGGNQFMEEGGEPNGGMALGQMAAVVDKMSKLRQFVSPDQNLDPWIASKLAVMDHSADAIADYMMYNPEAQEEGEEMEEEDEMQEMANGGYTVTRSNDRKGKTHKVTGPDGTVKYFGDSKLGQHPKDPERKKAFYARHKKNLEGNPYFRAFARATWKDGGSIFNDDLFYQDGGEPQLENYPDYGSWRADVLRYNTDQSNSQPQQVSMQEEPKVMWHPEWEAQGIDPETQSSAPKKAVAPINYSGVSIVDLLSSAGKASDYNSRKQLAAQMGIDNYYGSAKQNLELIKKVTSNPDALNDYKSVSSSQSKSSKKGTSRNTAGTNVIPEYLKAPETLVNPYFNTDVYSPFGQSTKPLEEVKRSSTQASDVDEDQILSNERKQASEVRRKVIKGDNNATFTFPDGKTKKWKDMSWKEQQYIVGRNLGSWNNDDWTDYINPAAGIGSLAEGLGTMFYNAEKQNSSLPYIKGIGEPLLAGALSAMLPKFTKTYPYNPLQLPAKAATKLPGKVAKALPQAAKKLTQGNPTNWVTSSGLSFKEGGINLDPAKKGTFKAQATRMGMGVQEAASAILNAPEGKYSPAMRKKANFAKNFAKQMGGPVEGEVLDVSPEQLELLRQQGYQFEIM